MWEMRVEKGFARQYSFPPLEMFACGGLSNMGERKGLWLDDTETRLPPADDVFPCELSWRLSQFERSMW